jgi:hypothetical protein
LAVPAAAVVWLSLLLHGGLMAEYSKYQYWSREYEYHCDLQAEVGVLRTP